MLRLQLQERTARFEAEEAKLGRQLQAFQERVLYPDASALKQVRV